MSTIADVCAQCDRLPDDERALFEWMFVLSGDTGTLDLPEELRAKVERWFALPGDTDLAEQACRRACEQRLVRVTNRATSTTVVYNPLRACRPQPAQPDGADPTEEQIAESEGVGKCDFCDPFRMTAADSWGRVETRHFVTASNVAKMDDPFDVDTRDHVEEFDAPTGGVGRSDPCAPTVPPQARLSGRSPEAPSEWVVRFAHHIPFGGAVCDVACGTGRHTRFLHGLGHVVTAVDRDTTGVSDLRDRVDVLELDLEVEGVVPAPFREEHRFVGVVVTDYLHRPLLAPLCRSLQKGGVLIYETFAIGNEQCGSSHPPFLLREGELLEVALQHDLHVVAYEHGRATHPRRAITQRICAIRRH